MDYYLYHDESKKHGYWHGMLLVPKETRHILLQKIQEIRENNRFEHVVNFKNVKKKNRVFYTNNSFLQVGIAALVQNFKGSKYPIYLGKRTKGDKDYEFFEDMVGAKFILFRERDNLKEMSDILDYGGKVETTMRMGLKGGIHFLGDENNPININRIHFDGHEHYQRNVDPERLIERFTDMRSYCSISNSENIIDDRSSKHDQDNSQDYDDCQLLQLTDVMVGSFRYLLTPESNEVYHELTMPAKKIVERYLKGKARMQNSRWNNSISISECYLENGNWQFETLDFQLQEADNQQELF